MSISMNNLPNELLLKICSRLSINDFVHLTSTSRHFYQFGQNFREEIFNAKTRLVLRDRHTVIENRLLKKCFDLCMEQPSEQATTDLPQENIAELTINLKEILQKFYVQGTNLEILNQFANITQLIVVLFDSNQYSTNFGERLIPVLSPFPRLRMLKIITHRDPNYADLFQILTQLNFADLTHLSLFCRQPRENSLLSRHLELPTLQMISRLNEIYIAGTFCDSNIWKIITFNTNNMSLKDYTKFLVGLIQAPDYTSTLRRVGFYFDDAQTCFRHVKRSELTNLKDQITHLTLHSMKNDYDTLTDEQLQVISNTFPAVQNFFPKALDDKIKQLIAK